MIARWFAGLALLLSAAPPLVAQTAATDTLTTVQGFVQEDPTTGAITIVTPLPVMAFEHSSYVVKLTTRTDKWSKFNGQFVEASGRLGRDPAGALLLAADAMKPVDPPDTAHRVYNSGTPAREARPLRNPQPVRVGPGRGFPGAVPAAAARRAGAGALHA